MENRVKREYFLRSSDFDCENRLSPTAVLDLFQDIASVHAEELGIGFDSLIKRNLIWVLVRTKYEQYLSPSRFQKVSVESWPCPPGRAGFSREYLIKNAEGETVIKGSSDWVVLDSVARKIVPAADIYPINDFCPDKNFPERLRKLPDFEGEDVYSLTPRFSQLDLNAHVNNTKYANYVLDCETLPRDKKITSLQIDYRKEVLSGDRIFMKAKREEDSLLYKGCDEEGNILFSCKIDIK